MNFKKLVVLGSAVFFGATFALPQAADAIAVFETVPIKEVADLIKGLDQDKFRAQDDELLFFEGNNCTQNLTGSAPYDMGDERAININAKERSWIKNDEARSLLIRGLKKGTLIVVYDNPDAKENDDFAVVEILKDEPDKAVCIGSFEQSFKSKSGDWRITFVHHNGLDGKVSHVRVASKPGWRDYPNDVVFYEGNDCKQGIKARYKSHRGGEHHYNCKNSKSCTNDEVRSVKLYAFGRRHYGIWVYDDPDGSHSDDYTIVDVKPYRHGGFVGDYCVKTFEKSHNLDKSGIDVSFHKHNGLDGKVSRILLETYGKDWDYLK
jgi:hypothetical protein